MTRFIHVVAALSIAACTLRAGLTGFGHQSPPASSPGATTPAAAAPATSTSEPEPATDPYATAPCPADLSLSVGKRTIDGRMPFATIKARYAKEHKRPATAKEFLTRDQAIDRIIALEAKKPGLVPAGFRADIASKGRDPAFRMYMARCELGSDVTVRRAGHDAALAYLLGTPARDAVELVSQAHHPDGYADTTCRDDGECGTGEECDGVTRTCSSARKRTASFLSPAELDVEDTLVRAYAALLGKHPDAGDLIEGIAYDLYVRCSGALCNFKEYKDAVVYWDRRYHGMTGGPSDDADGGGKSRGGNGTDSSAECFEHTGHNDLSGCTYNCGTGTQENEPACVAKCQAFCKDYW